MSKKCLECDSFIDSRVYDYSTGNFGVPLCIPHQNWVKDMPHETTAEALTLYFA